MNLPDLHKYRSEFEKEGVQLPLPIIPDSSTGLMAGLPLPANAQSGWPFTEETSSLLYDPSISWPKITIVTPSFNQDRFIEQTIRSVLLQNYPNLEYIIMDGGSTDSTVDTLKKYEPWISHWQTKQDKGQGQAINMGFSIASGAIYGWINSDDYYLKDTFIQVAKTFLKKKAEFVYGYGLNFIPATKRYELSRMLPHTDYFIKIPSLIQPSTFWLSTIHQPIWEELHCALDFELWLRLVKGKRRVMIRKSLSVAHIHDSAKTFDLKMKSHWEEDHFKIWSEDAHGRVYEWKKIVFFNRIRINIYKILGLI
ncbi:glycosyltransferase family 2 protein [Mucilaginibacter aquaedulcis]|uniref:glycosyltransferase family 2 protein n=1 Tax=Mucilaginibacter aquaedulcis TaxID=1187081 RepID=UPI0025B3F96C|nr:glycosyltransferase family 2 protein [Mucilaginibacter aquaedulcis]MDN3548730.1 glycosyltransferase family 2 protein [Mucilaginibacter aquaedulcis]